MRTNLRRNVFIALALPAPLHAAEIKDVETMLVLQPGTSGLETGGLTSDPEGFVSGEDGGMKLIGIGSRGRKTQAGTVTDRAHYRLEEVAAFSEVPTPGHVSAIANGNPIPAH